MRLLLDTHIFLWYITGDPRQPATVLPLIRDPANEVSLSVVSIWEAIVKYQLGIQVDGLKGHLFNTPLCEVCGDR